MGLREAQSASVYTEWRRGEEEESGVEKKPKEGEERKWEEARKEEERWEEEKGKQRKFKAFGDENCFDTHFAE